MFGAELGGGEVPDPAIDSGACWGDEAEDDEGSERWLRRAEG